jgi:sulfane dehydrogenase subunit SoxC
MEWRGAQLNGCQFTHGMVHNVMYTGVPLKYLLEEAGVKTNGKWVMPEGARCGRHDPLDPDGKGAGRLLVAFKMNGEALRPEQGYPLRLVVPGWEGNMWVKWLRRIEVGDQPWHRARKRRNTPTFWKRQGAPLHLGDGCQVGHHQPEPAGADHPRQGPTGVDRLAWSGNGPHHACGRVARRRQELASGAHRRAEPAEGAAPLLLEFDWDGSDLLLQSRADDETGYVQPTKDELAPCVARTRSITTTASRPGT